MNLRENWPVFVGVLCSQPAVHTGEPSHDEFVHCGLPAADFEAAV